MKEVGLEVKEISIGERRAYFKVGEYDIRKDFNKMEWNCTCMKGSISPGKVCSHISACMLYLKGGVKL